MEKNNAIAVTTDDPLFATLTAFALYSGACVFFFLQLSPTQWLPSYPLG